MALNRKESPESSGQGVEGGYEITESAEIIKHTLATLQKKRRFVILLHKGYQSSNTVLVGFSDRQVAIDKPVDWPSQVKRIRVAFRDESRVWNHFTVAVESVNENTITTSFPAELFRLQRRSHFRIDVPPGATVSFRLKGQTYGGLEVRNVSVGGVMVCLKKGRLFLANQDLPKEISEICLLLPSATGGLSGAGGEDQELVEVQSGQIVRTFSSQDGRETFFGIRFFSKANEERKLMQYVRQREIEILRRGTPA